LGIAVAAAPAAALGPRGQGAPGKTTTTGLPASTAAPGAVPRPRAWILVDADRGTVLDAGNDREPMPPASLTKLLTALVASDRLAPADTVPVTDRAAGEPASKINMKAGQVWPFRDALYALLLSSANDAAAAVGERVGGTLEAFATQMQEAGTELGLADNPVLRDPAGLDDNFSVDGGNLLSARDVAIVARAVLSQPLLAQVVSTPVYTFTGPDGVRHRLGNHNLLLTSYPGAIGEKTGYTRKSGEDLVAAARRDGRTLIAVVLGAPSVWRNASDLLDQGFAMPAGAPGTGDTLPAVHLPGSPPPTSPVAGATASTGGDPATSGSPAPHHRHRSSGTTAETVGLVVIGTTAIAVGARRRQVMRRRRRRIRAAAPSWVDIREGVTGSATADGPTSIGGVRR